MSGVSPMGKAPRCWDVEVTKNIRRAATSDLAGPSAQRRTMENLNSFLRFGAGAALAAALLVPGTGVVLNSAAVSSHRSDDVTGTASASPTAEPSDSPEANDPAEAAEAPEAAEVPEANEAEKDNSGAPAGGTTTAPTSTPSADPTADQGDAQEKAAEQAREQQAEHAGRPDDSSHSGGGHGSDDSHSGGHR